MADRTYKVTHILKVTVEELVEAPSKEEATAKMREMLEGREARPMSRVPWKVLPDSAAVIERSVFIEERSDGG